jgi:hypothetical protein
LAVILGCCFWMVFVLEARKLQRRSVIFWPHEARKRNRKLDSWYLYASQHHAIALPLSSKEEVHHPTNFPFYQTWSRKT